MAQVFKIKYDDLLRRVCAPLYQDKDAAGLSYCELEQKARDLFQIPSTSRVIITYLDTEDDVVTMADDQDLRDACVTQQLNPLKLELKVVPGEATNKTSWTVGTHTTEFIIESLLKGLFPTSTTQAIEQVLNRYPPYLFTTVPAHVLPEALDTFLKTLTGYRDDTKLVAPPLQKVKVEVDPRRLVHKRIECDHCFMFPIVGTRYKSTKKHDYDLCSACFNEVGNATDYVRMDPPGEIETRCQPPSISVKTVDNQYFANSASRTVFSRGPYGWVSVPKPHLAKAKDDKGTEDRLDAQFVLDVTVLDGTKLEVGTSFAKVWRLKNSGTLPWPQHTQLVRLYGDLFGPSSAVTLKLPEDGLPCGSELDVNVDLKAPENTGHYAAHWRLMAPSGKMFGHRVWVLIEAVPKCSKMQQACEAKESLIDEATLKDAKYSILESTVESMEECSVPVIESLIVEATLEDVVDPPALVDSDKEPLIDEATLEDGNNSILESTVESVEEGMVPVKEPLIVEATLEDTDVSLFEAKVIQGLLSLALGPQPIETECNSCSKKALVDPPALVDSDDQHGETDGFSLVENELVKDRVNDENLASTEEFELVDPLPHELASEEFNSNQHDVNTEPLQDSCSEDDSFACTGWDHMLKELEEMGFHDAQTNKNLLRKNEGSIKRAVKELVELEKQVSHKIKAA